MKRTSEEEISIIILQMARDRPDGQVTFKRAYAEIPNLITFSSGDLTESQKRPGEPMWYQLVRNIQSHHSTEGNFIEQGFLIHVKSVGYKITDAGLAYLKSRGL